MRRVAARAPFWMTLLTLLLAGCVQEAGGPPAASSSALPAAAPATVSEETGSIAGFVWDDEQRPMPGVIVAIPGSAAETRTDAEGAYTINDLAPGRHAVHFTRLGYVATGRNVDLAPGQVAYVNVTLTPFQIVEAYHFTISRSGFIKVGQWTVNHLQQPLNQSAVDGQLCDSCRHVISTPGNLSSVVMEPIWVRSSSLPYVNEKLGVGLSIIYGDGQLTSYFLIKNFVNRERYDWTDTNLKAVAPVGKFRLNLQGTAPPDIMFQQKVDMWMTFGVNHVIDGNFTALPPQ